MIVKDNLPLNLTEKVGFCCFMKTCLPAYKLPSRKAISKKLEEKYEVYSDMLKAKLASIENVSVTTDIWTETLNTQSFLGKIVDTSSIYGYSF